MNPNAIALNMDAFAQLLIKIQELKKEGQREEAMQLIGYHLSRLLKIRQREVRRLTEIGFLAHLIESGPMATVWLPYKQIMLIALLKETGDYAAVKDPQRGGNYWYLKALNLLLDALAKNELQDYSHLAPKVEDLLRLLGNSPIPAETKSRLAREFNRRGSSSQSGKELKDALEEAQTSAY